MKEFMIKFIIACEIIHPFTCIVLWNLSLSENKANFGSFWSYLLFQEIALNVLLIMSFAVIYLLYFIMKKIYKK